MPDAPHETLMTVDATTGQNGVRQAKLFGEAVGVTGIVLTKLDGTAKGGIALAIANELGIPVKLIGIGEQLEDLRPFDPDDFARALLTPEPRDSADRSGIIRCMDPWVLWLIAAVIFGVGEIATLGLLPRAVRGRRAGRRARRRGRRRQRDQPGRRSSLVSVRRCCSRCGRSRARTSACRRSCARAPPRWSAARRWSPSASPTTRARAA